MSDGFIKFGRHQQSASIIKLEQHDSMATSRAMLALARKGEDAPTSLTPEEIQELCLTVELHYAQMGIS